jgi:hypothetical protein
MASWRSPCLSAALKLCLYFIVSLRSLAIVQLSQFVELEPPKGVLERQALAGTVDDLMSRLRGDLWRLGHGALCRLVCSLAKLRAFDGQLLREAAAEASSRAADLLPRQSTGFLWAFSR